jgi:hypothetical protein
LGLVYYELASLKLFFVSFFVFEAEMTLAATGSIRCGHLPDSSIQLLQVKPWKRASGQYAPHCTTASAWPLKLPAIFVAFIVVVDFIVGHNHS